MHITYNSSLFITIHHYSSLFHHLMGFVATLKNEISARNVKLGAEDRDLVSYSGPNDKTSEKSKIACQDSLPEPRTEDGHTEKNYFFRAISIAYKPPCASRGFSHVSVEVEEVLHPKLLPRFLCWPACVALRWYWNSGARQRLAASLR